MKQGVILYEPLPIGRLGVRNSDNVVIIANDYSCFAQMLEEYISYGVTKIAISSSSPEIKTLSQMPLILRDRVHILDDSSERETLHRVLFNLRKEFEVKIDEEHDYLKFAKGTEKNIIHNIEHIHTDFKKIAIGFNHGVQTDVNTESLFKSLKFLRSKVTNTETRVLLAEIESLLNQYEKVEFKAITPPKGDTPNELMNLFDRLMNDKNYLVYSDNIQKLSLHDERNETLLKLRELTRILKSKNYIAEGWDYVSKLLKVWTGIPFPESKTIATLFKNKQLPTFVDMAAARQKAIEMWRSTDAIHIPLRRDGLPLSKDEITWIPILDSMKVRTDYNRIGSLGTVNELLKALEKVQRDMENN
jgi:hypothetical protein